MRTNRILQRLIKRVEFSIFCVGPDWLVEVVGILLLQSECNEK